MYVLVPGLIRDVGSRSIDGRCPVGVQGKEEALLTLS